MVAKFLDLKRWSLIWQKKTRKHWRILRNKTGAHTFLLWLDNAYGRHCQQRLLRKNCGNSNRRVLSALSGICSSNAFNSAFYHENSAYFSEIYLWINISYRPTSVFRPTLNGKCLKYDDLTLPDASLMRRKEFTGKLRITWGSPLLLLALNLSSRGSAIQLFLKYFVRN